MTNLLSELDAVPLYELTMVSGVSPQNDFRYGFFFTREQADLVGAFLLDQDREAQPEWTHYAINHHAEIAAAVMDKRRVDFIEQKAADGWCPGLINDDNGHWAWSDSCIQPVPDGDDSQTMATTFFVEADQWKPTLREAIDAVMNDDAAMSAREGQG